MRDFLEPLRLTFPYRVWMSIYFLFKKKYFTHLKTFCFFIGYPRSGHTLIGALIDAHPNAFMGIEVNVLNLLKHKFNRNQVLGVIVRRNNFFYKKWKGIWTGYNYKVDGLWQNSFEEVHLIGDKKGTGTTHLLQQHPELLNELQHEINLPLKIIHVVRNPYDIITTAALHKARKVKINPDKIFDAHIDAFIRFAETNNRLISEQGNIIHTLKHEELIASPKKELGKLFHFLGLSYDTDYINKLAKVIYKEPNITRNKFNWTLEQIAKVAEIISRYDFLKGYSYNG